MGPKRLQELVIEDQQQGYNRYTPLRKIFSQLLENGYYERQKLYSVLGLMAGYPTLEMPRTAIDTVHRSLSIHLHRMNSMECSQCLLFLAKADPTYQDSQLY